MKGETMATRWLTSEKLGCDICEALGFEANMVQSLTISCAAGKAVTISIKCLAGDDQSARLTDTFKQYRLVPIEDDAEPDDE